MSRIYCCCYVNNSLLQNCSFASIIEVTVANLPPCLFSIKLKLRTTRDHALMNYITNLRKNANKGGRVQGVRVYKQVVSLQLLPQSFILPSQSDLIIRSVTKESPTYRLWASYGTGCDSSTAFPLPCHLVTPFGLSQS